MLNIKSAWLKKVFCYPRAFVWSLPGWLTNSKVFSSQQMVSTNLIFISLLTAKDIYWNRITYILTVVLAPGFHSWLAQLVWSHLVSSASHSSGRNQMESVMSPSPLASHAPEGCSALSYHPHCRQGREKSLLEVVTITSYTHKIKVLITSCKFLYNILISGMDFMKYDYSILQNSHWLIKIMRYP